MGAELKRRVGFKIETKIETNVKELRVGLFGEQAQKGYWNEYGEGNAPPRPFMRYFANYVKQGVSDIYTDEFTGVHFNYLDISRIGAILAGDLQDIIEDWSQPPNAPSTIRKKGFNNPLIHTRDMVNSAWYAIGF